MGKWIALAIVLAVASPTPFASEEELPLYQRIETPPAPILTPEEALESFRLAPRFRIEAVAVEPLIEDPVAITWDETGAMYVAEMRAYMQDSHGTDQDEPIGEVARLTDRDGDGQFDHREVLLGGLVLPRAVAVIHEGLLIAEPPHLWLCPSDTGRAADIDCDRKRSLGSYGDQPGSVEHAENGLVQGLDGWLYSAKSDRRLRVRDGALEQQVTLFRGQWGIARDDVGRLYYNTNSTLLHGDYFPAEAVVGAGRNAAPGLNERVNTDDSMYAVRVNTGVNRAYVPGVLREDGRLDQPTSASGMTAYRGDQFPDAHAFDFFVAEPAANAVAHLVGEEAGLQVRTRHALYPDAQWGQREFLASSDERFRPVDATVGPDGALYIVDFYRGIIQDHVFITEQLRAQVRARGLDRPLGMGRIWRITHEDGPATRFSGDLAALPSVELVELLGHSNGWHRDTAARLLEARLAGEETTDIHELLREAVARGAASEASEESALRAMQALWILGARDALQTETVVRALHGHDLELARQALHAGNDLLDRTEAVASLERHSGDARFRQMALLALAPHAGHADVQRVLRSALLASADEPWSAVAIQAALAGHELEFLILEGDPLPTAFVESLAAQMLARADVEPGRVSALLDLIATRSQDDEAFQRAALLGMHQTARGAGFQRVVLAQPHPIFEEGGAPEALWPAISRARQAVTWPNDDLQQGLKPLTPDQQRRMQEGREYYAANCSICHGAGGDGIASLGPPLVDSPWVTTGTERLARIVLNGLQGPIEVAGEAWNGVMPGHAHVPQFTDEVASGLLTFLHRSWGHRGRAIDPPFVAAIRSEVAGRSLPWTVAELDQVAINTHYADYEGAYGPPSFQLRFELVGGALVLGSAIFNGPVLEITEDEFLFEARGLPLEFERDDAGVVVAVVMRGDGGGTRLPRMPAQ